jgi:integrase
MFKGVRYYVSTRELGTPPTMADSLLAANRWWEAKMDELTGRTARPAPGTPAARAALLEAWNGGPLEGPDQAQAALADLIAYYQDKPIPQEVRQAALGVEKNAELEAGVNGLLDGVTSPPAGDTVGSLVRRWVADERRKVEAGMLGADRWDSNRRCLVHFQDWLGADSSPQALDELKWRDWYNYLAGEVASRKWAASHARRIYAVAKRFVRFLWEVRKLDQLPRTLDSSSLTFKVPPREVEIFTEGEICSLYGKIPDTSQSKLHFLLMLNCGMLAVDINDLREGEVDWDAGTVTRKRSKTRGEKNCPVVRYKLWGSTFGLLKRWRSADPEIVLLTRTGGRWIVPHQGDGSYSRSDCVSSAMRKWMREAGVKRPVKALRATASSKLGEHPQYKFYIDYFLGHSPKTVAERSYYKPTDGEFFEALEWLERGLGLK